MLGVTVRVGPTVTTILNKLRPRSSLGLKSVLKQPHARFSPYQYHAGSRVMASNSSDLEDSDFTSDDMFSHSDDGSYDFTDTDGTSSSIAGTPAPSVLSFGSDWEEAMYRELHGRRFSGLGSLYNLPAGTLDLSAFHQ